MRPNAAVGQTGKAMPQTPLTGTSAKSAETVCELRNGQPVCGCERKALNQARSRSTDSDSERGVGEEGRRRERERERK